MAVGLGHRQAEQPLHRHGDLLARGALVGGADGAGAVDKAGGGDGGEQGAGAGDLVVEFFGFEDASREALTDGGLSRCRQAAGGEAVVQNGRAQFGAGLAGGGSSASRARLAAAASSVGGVVAGVWVSGGKVVSSSLLIASSRRSKVPPAAGLNTRSAELTL